MKANTSVLSITRSRIRRAVRDAKEGRGQALSEADLDRLPDIVSRPHAVLLDKDSGALVYVCTYPDGEDRFPPQLPHQAGEDQQLPECRVCRSSQLGRQAQRATIR